MPTESQFREIYEALSKQLQLAPVESPEYRQLLQEWHQAGTPHHIKTFLFRQAKTIPDLPQMNE
ncbi:MAG: hypothetical protein SH850_09495 [Planctomycetaceae bacterium]|nr:hypothetical protein [Planctomycetaceae bacterium]